MQTSGAVLLRQFLTDSELRQADAARALDVSSPTIHDWLDEAKRPTLAYRDAIEKWTNGAVPATSWETDEEREIVDRVTPFVPKPAEAA